jgi:hypothetical protein
MYNRYKQTSIQGLTVNQQIATVLKDINKKLQESENLFRSYKLAASIDAGEKAIYKSIALSNIMEDYIKQTLEQHNNNDEVAEGLKELQMHFDNLHKTINQYVVRRNKDLFEKITINLKAMEEFWESLPPPQG